MAEPTNDSRTVTSVIPKPNLLAPTSSEQSHNVLDALTSQRSKTSAFRWMGWLALPLLAATAWGITTFTIKEPAQTVASSPATEPAVASDPPPQPTVAESSTVAASQETAIQLPKPATNGSPQQAAKKSIKNNKDAAKPIKKPSKETIPKTNAKKPALTKSQPVSASAKTPATKAEVNTKTSSKVTQAPNTKPRPEPSKTSPVKASTEKPVSKTAQKHQSSDPDVELLSALMKHLAKDNTPKAQTSEPQTIAQLVKSCQRRDPIETMLCQRRICAGSWGKAQACPQKLAPRSTASNAQTKAPT